MLSQSPGQRYSGLLICAVGAAILANSYVYLEPGAAVGVLQTTGVGLRYALPFIHFGCVVARCVFMLENERFNHGAFYGRSSLSNFGYVATIATRRYEKAVLCTWGALALTVLVEILFCFDDPAHGESAVGIALCFVGFVFEYFVVLQLLQHEREEFERKIPV